MSGEGFTVWFTGLSGAGKSTISGEIARRLRAIGREKIEILDGDTVRTHLSKGLGFSKEDRDTNVLRIGFVCEMLSRNGVIAIAAAISPYRDIRDRVRTGIIHFVEVFVSAPLETLAERDTKGLYKKALAGEIKNFTGVSDPYEPPLNPEVILNTDKESIDTSVNKLLRALELLGFVTEGNASLGQSDENDVAEQLKKAGRLSVWQSREVSTGDKSTGALDPIAPHGGVLVDRFLPARERDELLSRVELYPAVTLNPRQWSDVELIATGAYSPLDGFIGERDYREVLNNGRFSNGLAWTIPILLLVDGNEEAVKKRSEEVVLRDENGRNLAVLHVSETFKIDRDEMARKIWRTADDGHPGVKNLFHQGDIALAGTIDVIRLNPPGDFLGYRLAPAETRKYFRDRGWKSVAAFQTRNPIHRAHEYLHKIALELVDGLLLHPLVGETKSDDVPAEVRMECYKALLAEFYPRDRVLLSVIPAAMRYAGPKEAIHHAIMRQNYGCTHFIVGRDHAGVGNYYGTYDAQNIFDEYSKDELAIKPLKFEHAFYCRKCHGMASERTCPHAATERIILSGTKVRELLSESGELPTEFSRPQVVSILRDYYAKKKHVS